MSERFSCILIKESSSIKKKMEKIIINTWIILKLSKNKIKKIWNKTIEKELKKR